MQCSQGGGSCDTSLVYTFFFICVIYMEELLCYWLILEMFKHVVDGLLCACESKYA